MGIKIKITKVQYLGTCIDCNERFNTNEQVGKIINLKKGLVVCIPCYNSKYVEED